MPRAGFFKELQRHHVFRVAAAYAVVGWLVIQVVAILFPVLDLPAWLEKIIVVLVLAGFPVALVAAQIGPDRAAADAALQDLIAHGGADTMAYQIAEVYALRKDPDAMFKWLQRAWANRDSGLGTLLYTPFFSQYRRDPRFAAFCRKVGLPVTSDAKTMP